MTELEDAKKENDLIQASEEVKCEIISSDFLSSQRGKFIKLLDEEINVIKFGKKDNRIFEFEDSVFIKTISFISDKENTTPNLFVEIFFSNGQTKSYSELNKSPHAENRNFIVVNNFVKSFSIRSDRLLRDEAVKRVIVNGLAAEQFYSVINKASEFIDRQKSLKNDSKLVVQKFEERLNEIQSKTDNLTKQNDELEQSLEETQNIYKTEQQKLEKLQEISTLTGMSVNTLQSSCTTLSEKEVTIKNSIEELTQTKSNLNKEISDLKGEISKLSSHKGFYAETMFSYMSESRSQLIIYYVFIVISILGLTWMGVDSVKRINELIAEYHRVLAVNPTASSWHLIALRIPYASIILAVFGGIVALINTLLSKVFEIHAQKRHIIGLSVLARDVNLVATHELNLSVDEIYKHREKLKLELLSESIVGQAFKAVSDKRNEKKATSLVLPKKLEEDVTA